MLKTQFLHHIYQFLNFSSSNCLFTVSCCWGKAQRSQLGIGPQTPRLQVICANHLAKGRWRSCPGQLAKGTSHRPNGECAWTGVWGSKPTLARCAMPHWREIRRHWSKLLSASLFTGMSSHIIAFDAIVFFLIWQNCFSFYLLNIVLTTEGSEVGIVFNMHKLLN